MKNNEALENIQKYLALESRERSLSLQMMEEVRLLSHQQLREERDSIREQSLLILRSLRASGYCVYQTPREEAYSILELEDAA